MRPSLMDPSFARGCLGAITGSKVLSHVRDVRGEAVEGEIGAIPREPAARQDRSA